MGRKKNACYLIIDRETCSKIIKRMYAKEIMQELGITNFQKFYNLLMHQQLYKDYYVIEDE